MNRHTTTTNLLTQTSLLKIALVAREKSTIKKIAESTELSEAYIRKMLHTHKEYFQITGYVMNELKNRPTRQHRVREGVIDLLNRNIDELQKVLIEGNKPVPASDFVQQVAYKNTYDQLFGNAHFIQCKIGQLIPFSETKNERMSGVTRNYVSGATLSI